MACAIATVHPQRKPKALRWAMGLALCVALLAVQHGALLHPLSHRVATVDAGHGHDAAHQRVHGREHAGAPSHALADAACALCLAYAALAGLVVTGGAALPAGPYQMALAASSDTPGLPHRAARGGPIRGPPAPL